MGLFDKILKGAVDAIDNAAAKNGNGPTGLKDLFNQAMDCLLYTSDAADEL